MMLPSLTSKRIRIIAVGLALIISTGLIGVTGVGAAGVGLDPSFGEGGVALSHFANTPDRPGALLDTSAMTGICMTANPIWIGGSSGRPGGSDFAAASYQDSAPPTSLLGKNLLIADAGGEETGTGLAARIDGLDGFVVVSGYSTGTTGTDFALAVSSCSTMSWTTRAQTLDLGGTDRANAVVFQSSYKVVLAGVSDANGSNDFALTRLTLGSRGSANQDATFGSGGTVLTDLSGTGSDDQALALAVQPDTRLIAAGVSDGRFALARYTTDGLLDATFNSTGIVTTSLGAGTTARASAIAIQPDGKIVVAGDSNGDFALARYSAAGALDSTFGIGGLVTTDFGGTDIAVSIQIQPDGKLLVAGSSSSQHALARYNANGSLDTGFGTAGKALFGAAPSTTYTTAGAIIQSDGKILLAGGVSSAGVDDIDALRLNANGTLDTTFGSDGWQVMEMGSYDAASDLVIQTDGKIVAGGRTKLDHIEQFALARYNTDGGPDPSFGQNGLATPTVGLQYAIALQADGKIVAAGSVQDTILARLNTDGSLDSGFGSAGVVTHDSCSGSTDYVHDVAIQPDQKIVVTGDCVMGRMMVARFNSDGSPDTSFGLTGVVTSLPLSSRDGQKVVIQSDSKIVAVGQGAGPINVVRLNADGSLDTGFGTGGISSQIFPVGNLSFPKTLLLQPDGKIVVGGYATTNNQYWDWGMLRLNTDGTLDSTFDGDGALYTDLGANVEAIAAMTLQPDGKILVGGYKSDSLSYASILARYNPDGSLDSTFGSDGLELTGTRATIASLTLDANRKLLTAGGTNEGTSSSFKLARLILDITPPDAPDGLSAAPTSQTQIDLSWTDHSTNETSFRIERSSDNITFAEIGSVDADATSYSDTTLSCGQTVYYRVRARNAAGDSAFSNTASAASVICAPSAPSGLTAARISQSRVDLSWTDTSTNETSFRIERSADNITFTEIGSVGAGISAYSDTTTVCGQTYTYRVLARNAGGDSAFSNTASVTNICAPSGLSTTPVSQTQIDLSWTDNSSDETGFRVERSPDGTNGWAEIGATAVNVTAYSDTSMPCGRTGYYRVKAVNAGASSNYTAAVNGSTPTCTSGHLFDMSNYGVLVGEGQCLGGGGASGIGVAGSTIAFNGNVVSNGNVTFSGSSGHPIYVNGDVTAGGLVDPAASSSTAIYSGAVTSGAPQQTFAPLWDITDFRPGGAIATLAASQGAYYDISSGALPALVDGRRPPGIYYSSGGINKSTSSLGPDLTHITWVAEGPIFLSSLGVTPKSFSPYNVMPGYPLPLIFAMGGPAACTTSSATYAIDFSGSGAFSGLLYAPNGKIAMSTPSGASLSGGIAGLQIDLSGSSYTFTFDPARLPRDTFLPAAPTGLSATPSGQTRIDLSWADSSSNETSFRIERSPDNVTFTEIGSVGVDVTSYSDTTAACGQTYTYRVRARNAGGDSAASDTASATTDDCAPIVSLSGTSHDFGSAGVGQSSAPFEFMLTNTGGLSLAVGALSLTDGTDFSLDGGTCSGQTIEPLATCTFSVTFSPILSLGAKSDTVNIPSDAASSVDTITLSGTSLGVVTIAETNGSTNVTEGGATDSYTVVLNGQPAADVTISFSTGAQLQPIPDLTFTTSDWNTPQVAAVMAVDDTLAQGPRNATIMHTASGGGYDGVSIASVVVHIADDETTRTPPVPRTPKNGAPVYKTPRLSWKVARIKTLPVLGYHVEIMDEQGSVVQTGDPVRNNFATSWLPFGIYSWHVAVRDANGLSTPSVPFSFEVTLLKSPKMNQLVKSHTPKFAWRGVRYATFLLQISSTNSFTPTTPTPIGPLLKPVYATPSTSPMGPGVYYWRISPDSGLTWTPVRTFTIAP